MTTLLLIVLFIVSICPIVQAEVFNDSITVDFQQREQCKFAVQTTSLQDSVTVAIDDSLVIVPRQIRNVAWITPSKATTINGWSIGWMPISMTLTDRVRRATNINGLHTGISPLGALMIAYSPLILFSGQIWESALSLPDTTWEIPKSDNRLNGMAINLIEMMDYYTVNGVQISAIYNSVNISNGLSINALAYNGQRVNGISIAGLGSRIYEVNGLSISGICNINNSMKGLQIGAINMNNCTYGLQIGLFNKTKKLKGAQLGLWNKNGKLGLPFLNIGW